MTQTAHETHFERRNLVATFQGLSKAREAARELSGSVPHARIEVRPKSQQSGVQYAEMRDEVEGVVASPALGSAMNRSQFQGALQGAAIVGGIAIALGLLAGAIFAGSPGAGWSMWQWIFTWALIPAFAGGTLGALAGGMLKPRQDPAREYEAAPENPEAGEGMNVESEEVSVQVSTDSEEDFRQALAMLQQMNPGRLDRLSEAGEVQATKETGQGRSDSEGTPPGRTDVDV
ncbi:MAG: hypothetical protein KY393_03955 [Actinobacteria bacterium]|nr:hypothetical protein [Actinomycetota bacterium]